MPLVSVVFAYWLNSLVILGMVVQLGLPIALSCPTPPKEPAAMVAGDTLRLQTELPLTTTVPTGTTRRWIYLPLVMKEESSAEVKAAAVRVEIEPAVLQPGETGLVIAWVGDETGEAMADGYTVTFESAGGNLSEETAATREGLAQVTITAGTAPGGGLVRATAGEITGTAGFSVTAESGTAVSGNGPAVPAAELGERARNRLKETGSGRWQAANNRYAAVFNKAGMSLAVESRTPPAGRGLVRQTEETTGLSYRLQAIERGGETVYRAGAEAAVEVTGNTISYQRGAGIVEQYVSRDSGLQQVFVFETPLPGTGDLVIRGEFETALQAYLMAGDEGVQFYPADVPDEELGQQAGVVRYTGALATDAAGQTTMAELALTGAELAIKIPGEWLAEAEYPVSIDPMIGDPVLVSDPRAQQGEAAVAFNPAADQYLVVWSGYDTGGAAADLEGQLVAADGTPAGELLVIADAPGDQQWPSVAYNTATHEYLVVWTDYRADEDGDVYGQRLAADGSLLGENFAIGATEALQNRPDVAYNTADNLYLAVWRDRRGPAIYVYGQVIGASGVLSGTNVAVYNGTGDNEYPGVAYNAVNNEYLAVWSRWSWDIYGKRVSGRGKLLDNPGTTADESLPGQAFIINAAANGQNYPAVAADGESGKYLVVWRDYRSESRGDIYGQMIGAGGALAGSEIAVNAASGVYQARPDVAYDGVNDRYLAVWQDDRSGGGFYGQMIEATGGLSGAVKLIVPGGWPEVIRLTGNSETGGYLAVWRDGPAGSINIYGEAVSGTGEAGSVTAIGPITGGKYYPWAAYNSTSEEYLLVWQDYRDGVSRVYGQRLTAGGEKMGDNLMIGEAGGGQFSPRVAASGESGYLVVWEDRRNDSNGDVYGQRVTTDGQLSGGNVAIAAATGVQKEPDAAYSPIDGSYLVVWRDARNDYKGDIYGQRMGTNGALLNSYFIISDYQNNSRIQPAVIYNPVAGHYLVVWAGWQTGSEYDIFGQQVAGNGTLLDNPGTPADESLPTTVFLLSNASGEQRYVQAATDRQTGISLVVWWDVRANPAVYRGDVYGQILAANGSLIGGNLAVSAVSADQRLPMVGTLGSRGQFLVAWADSRNGGWKDIYGQRIGTAGEPVGENQPVAANVGWVDGLSLTGRPDAPEVLLSFEWQNQIYARRYGEITALFESATARTGKPPLTITFTNHSTPIELIADYRWNFGDRTTGNEVSPTHTYTRAGVYTVSLTAAGNGGSDTLTRTGYITVSGTTPITREWRLVTTTVTVPVIGEQAMAYDYLHNVTVLYGGNTHGWPYETATRTFDGTDWITVTTTTHPAARYGAAMAYDSLRQTMVLFGGSDENDTPLNQTRVYTAGEWVDATPTTSPPNRTNAAMTAGNNGEIYLFGGNAGETYFNDLWKYEAGNWQAVPVSGTRPVSRTLTAMTWNPDENTLLLFGGRSDTGTALADLWAFDPGSNEWTELDGGGDGSPPARYAHSLTFDPDTSNLVLVGGAADAGDTLLSDTWFYRDNGWTRAAGSPLPAMAYHRMVYDPASHRLLLVGNGEVWLYE